MARRKGITSRLKNSCLGKVQHKSRLAAEYVLDTMRNTDLEIYHCQYCKFYHIGHKFGVKSN